MSSSSQFFGSALPVGALVEAYGQPTDASYLPADGRKVLRADYPQLSACLPNVPTATYTQRALGLPISSPVGCAHAGLWLLASAVGASSVQTSADGIGWTQRTTAASTTPRAIISTGVRAILVSGVGSAVNPQTSLDGITWTTSASAVNCPNQSNATLIAYAPNLGVNGRVVFLSDLGGVCTSDDHGVTWSIQSVPGGVGTGLCWTGVKFLYLSGPDIYESATGLTGSWARLAYRDPSTFPALTSIVSDGAGRIAIFTGTRLLVSGDFGASWDWRDVYGARRAAATSGTISYSGGLFYLVVGNSFGNALLVSKNATTWAYASDAALLLPAATGIVITKSGINLLALTSQTVAYTSVDDAAKMYLPYVAGTSAKMVDTFVKVR